MRCPMSPTSRPKILLSTTTTTTATFVLILFCPFFNPVLSCYCSRSNMSTMIDWADFAAVVTINDKVHASFASSSSSVASSSFVSPLTSAKLHALRPNRVRPKRLARIEILSSSGPGARKLIGANKIVSSQPQLESNLKAKKLTKRELPQPINGIALFNLNEKEWWSFSVTKKVKANTNSTSRLLDQGQFYLEPSNTCNPNVETGKSYAIWGKLVSGQIKLELCNVLPENELSPQDRTDLGLSSSNTQIIV